VSLYLQLAIFLFFFYVYPYIDNCLWKTVPERLTSFTRQHNIISKGTKYSRVYSNSIFASRIALHLSPRAQVPIEILEPHLIYDDHYYFAFTTPFFSLSLPLSLSPARYRYTRNYSTAGSTKIWEFIRRFIKANTKGGTEFDDKGILLGTMPCRNASIRCNNPRSVSAVFPRAHPLCAPTHLLTRRENNNSVRIVENEFEGRNESAILHGFRDCEIPPRIGLNSNLESGDPSHTGGLVYPLVGPIHGRRFVNDHVYTFTTSRMPSLHPPSKMKIGMILGMRTYSV